MALPRGVLSTTDMGGLSREVTPQGAGSSEHSPREIGARAVFKVSTEEIISRGESPRSRTGRSGYGVNEPLIMKRLNHRQPEWEQLHLAHQGSGSFLSRWDKIKVAEMTNYLR